MKQAARKAHRRIWSVLALILPCIILFGLMIKQSPLDGRPAVQLEKPEAE